MRRLWLIHRLLKPSAIRRAIGSTLLLLVAACSDSTTLGPPCADPAGGVFIGEASSSGDIRGCASYAVATGGGSPNTVLLITVGSAGNPDFQVSLVRSGTRPPLGTYPVGVNAGDFSGAIIANPGGRTFSITSGNVTIDASIAGNLQGSFGVTGTQSGSGTLLTISGLFTAVCTQQGSVTC